MCVCNKIFFSRKRMHTFWNSPIYGEPGDFTPLLSDWWEFGENRDGPLTWFKEAWGFVNFMIFFFLYTYIVTEPARWPFAFPLHQPGSLVKTFVRKKIFIYFSSGGEKFRKNKFWKYNRWKVKKCYVLKWNIVRKKHSSIFCS